MRATVLPTLTEELSSSSDAMMVAESWVLPEVVAMAIEQQVRLISDVRANRSDLSRGESLQESSKRSKIQCTYGFSQDTVALLGPRDSSG